MFLVIGSVGFWLTDEGTKVVYMYLNYYQVDSFCLDKLGDFCLLKDGKTFLFPFQT